MSRWYLTSNESVDRAADAICQRAQLRSAGRITGQNHRGQSYFKRVVDTPNQAQCGENGWICTAGTLIYNGHLGTQALRDCFDDFARGGIPAIHAKAIGHYAVAIKQNDEIIIFTDPQGALNLYYTDTGSSWFVSNSLHLSANVLPDRQIDATKLIVTILQSSPPGKDTFYSGIKRLFGTQAIRINLARGTFRLEDIPEAPSAQSWRQPTIHAAIDEYKSVIREVFGQLKGIPRIGLLGTGGLDSRTILASLIDQQVAPQMMYAMGNNRLTDYHPGDLAVAKKIADLYHLPFQQLDWSGHQPHSLDALRELFHTYGFKYEIYGAPDGFLRAFNGGIQSYPGLFLGGYSPAFTNSKPWQLKQTSFSFDYLLDNSMSFQGGSVETSKCINDKASYRSVLATEVKMGLRCGRIDFAEAGNSLEAYVKAKLFLYLRAESRFLNLINDFAHYVAPFLMKRLYDPLLNVPFEYRANDEFQIRLIHALAPDLVNVPLYSGWAEAWIDKDRFQLSRSQIHSRPSVLRRAAKQLVPAPLRASVRHLLTPTSSQTQAALEKPSPRDAAVLEEYGRQVMNDPIGRRWFSSTSEFTPKILARIHHYLTGINALGFSEVQWGQELGTRSFSTVAHN